MSSKMRHLYGSIMVGLKIIKFLEKSKKDPKIIKSFRNNSFVNKMILLIHCCLI